MIEQLELFPVDFYKPKKINVSCKSDLEKLPIDNQKNSDIMWEYWGRKDEDYADSNNSENS